MLEPPRALYYALPWSNTSSPSLSLSQVSAQLTLSLVAQTMFIVLLKCTTDFLIILAYFGYNIYCLKTLVSLLYFLLT